MNKMTIITNMIVRLNNNWKIDSLELSKILEYILYFA